MRPARGNAARDSEERALRKLSATIAQCSSSSFFATDRVALTLCALEWCRKRNAGIRFESDGTVSVWANGKRRRRAAFVDAVKALMEALK